VISADSQYCTSVSGRAKEFAATTCRSSENSFATNVHSFSLMFLLLTFYHSQVVILELRQLVDESNQKQNELKQQLEQIQVLFFGFHQVHVI
jgi:hypothetical protein